MASDGGLESGVSTLQAGTKAMEVIANNVAGVNVPAFKSSSVLYSDSFYQTLQQSAPNPAGGGGSNTPSQQVGSGAQIHSIHVNYEKGNARYSAESSHIAIDGAGWFRVGENDIFATRNGAFRKDPTGFLVTNKGDRLQGAVFDSNEFPTYTVSYDATSGSLIYTKDTPPGTPATPTIGSLNVDHVVTVGNSRLTKDVSIPGSITDEEINRQAPKVTEYSINELGEITLTMSNGDTFQSGQVLLMQFADEQALMNQGEGMYTGFASAGQLPFTVDGSKPGNGGLGKILQNRLEASNVDLTEEFAKIISTQKYIQAGARVVKTSAEVLNEVVNIIR